MGTPPTRRLPAITVGPAEVFRAVPVHGYSFPSGHTVTGLTLILADRARVQG